MLVSVLVINLDFDHPPLGYPMKINGETTSNNMKATTPSTLLETTGHHFVSP